MTQDTTPSKTASTESADTRRTMLRSIPIADPDVGAAEAERVAAVIDSGRLADGPEVRAFESEFADYCGTDHAVATSNGTTALHAALVAAGVGPGDRVLTTPFTFIATANAIRLCGATPVFADIDPVTYNLDPAAVERQLEAESVDAILAVHLYGLPAPMGALRRLADEYHLTLIEDAAQAHGAAIDGQRVGSLSDAATFSFYPTKNMTTGEGGMITTDSSSIAAHARSFINHGRTDADSSYEHHRVGHNFRMTSLCAAIGREQLEKLPSYVESRRRNAERYTETLTEVPSIRPPAEPDGYRHSYHQYTVRCSDREALAEWLDDGNISSGVYYPRGVHEQPPYVGSGSYPAAERATETVLSVPVHPGLDEAAVERVADRLARFDR
jgi:dTDP-4-amino-4,6-dideoxygalactose transaminase